MLGDAKSWEIVIENIITNQIRYASKKVNVYLENSIKVLNDGEPIPDEIINDLKKPFVKGKDGHNGLGLSIIDSIVSMYGYRFDIKNAQAGVLYHIFKE